MSAPSHSNLDELNNSQSEKCAKNEKNLKTRLQCFENGCLDFFN